MAEVPDLMAALEKSLGIDPRCPGVTEYGHGLTLTTVHGGGCCERWADRNRRQSGAVRP